jgi:hypothetical protein
MDSNGENGDEALFADTDVCEELIEEINTGGESLCHIISEHSHLHVVGVLTENALLWKTARCGGTRKVVSSVGGVMPLTLLAAPARISTDLPITGTKLAKQIKMARTC